MEQAHGWLLLIFSLAMVFYAIPMQIIKNYKDGRCGIAIALAVCPLAVYLLRATFAFTKGFSGAWYIYVPDTTGAILSVLLLFQYFGFFIKKR